MKFTVFGIGSATPQLDKNPSAFLVQIENEYILIDCGEGTQYRLLEAKIKHTRLKTICISHLHGDHYFGLAGLLSSLSLNRRKEPITLIGPPGLIDILNLQFKSSGTILSFELNFIPTDNSDHKRLLDNGVFSIDSFPLIHRVPTTGFLITQKAGLRHLLADKLPENFPIPYIKKLKEGADVYDEMSGKTFLCSEFTSEGEPEKKLAYCSDTAYNPSMIPVIKDANFMYHEATFTSELKSRAEKTQHSTAAQAAEIAQMANIGMMVIGHFSSRYKEFNTHLAEAKEVFEATFLAEEGKAFTII